jgi:hypothetical protein
MSADDGTYVLFAKKSPKSKSPLYIVKRGHAVQNTHKNDKALYDFFKNGYFCNALDDALYMAEIAELEGTGFTEYGITLVVFPNKKIYWSEFKEKYEKN